MNEYGALALIPPIVAIGAAIFTKRVYQSILLGMFVAAIIVTVVGSGATWWKLPFLAMLGGFFQTISWLVSGLANEGHAGVIAFTLFLGALVAVMQRSGAIAGFGALAIRYAKTNRSGQTIAWATGALFLAIDDYFHVIAAGTIFRPVTDGLKISREKLAYIIDSTAAPMVILVPISTWVGFILGVTGPALVDNGLSGTAFARYLEGIPFNFYAILTVAFVGVVALSGKDFGPMRKAERRARVEGKVLADGAKPLMSRELGEMEPAPNAKFLARNLAIPVAFLFASSLAMLYVTGIRNLGGSGTFVQALQNSSAELSLAIASFLTLLLAMSMYSIQGILRQDEFLDTVMEGFKAMVPALAILALAWGIGEAVGSATGVGLGPYLASSFGDNLDVEVIPLLMFLAGAVIAFSTGTSFGTFSIMVPVSLGLVAAANDPGPWIGPALAGALGGAVFGDHCSPISDTTVMSSMAGQSDHIDHVRTQLPYAVLVAFITCAGYFTLWITGSGAVAWIVNGILFALVVAFMFISGRKDRASYA